MLPNCSKKAWASYLLVESGMIPHQHGSAQSALFCSMSNTKASASSGEKVGRGVQVGVMVGVMVRVGLKVGESVFVGETVTVGDSVTVGEEVRGDKGVWVGGGEVLVRLGTGVSVVAQPFSAITNSRHSHSMVWK